MGNGKLLHVLEGRKSTGLEVGKVGSLALERLGFGGA